MKNKDVLCAAWNKQAPSCGSCGWSPCFYEIEDRLEETEPDVYHASCISKDDEDSHSHRGYFLYLNDQSDAQAKC